jgi:hypothetical protein
MSIKKRSNIEWRALIAECESSGMTQRDWCVANNVNFYTYADRARRLRRMDEEGLDGPIFSPKERSGWVEIQEQVPDADNKAPIESPQIEMPPGEIRIEIGIFTVSVTGNFHETAFIRVMTALAGVGAAREVAQ